MIFDDAIVHNGDLFAAHVRVGVALGRHTMGGPPGVRNAQCPLDLTLFEQLLQLGDLADRTDALQSGILATHSDTGRIVSAVFEAAQSLHKDRDDIALGDGSYDAAHGGMSPAFDL